METATPSSSSDSVSRSPDSSSSMEVSAPRPPLLPPCRVCGDKASGYHYGVNTCEGCKGFFRRTLTKKITYSCYGGGQCKIGPNKRQSCPSCRYDKCLRVGMSKQAIKTGRYSHATRTKYIQEVKKLEAGVSGSPDVSPGTSVSSDTIGDVSDVSNPGSVDSSITRLGDYDCSDSVVSPKIRKTSHNTFEPNEEFEQLIRNLVDHMKEDFDAYLDEEGMLRKQRTFHKYLQETGGKGPKNQLPISKEEYNYFYKTTGIELDNRKDLMTYWAQHLVEDIKNYVKFAKLIPGFKQLVADDQIGLIKAAQLEFWLLGHFPCMNAELGVFTGETMNSIEELTTLWDKEYLEQLYVFCEGMKTMKLTREEIALLRALSITFADRVSLKQKGEVENIQHNVVECFKYLCKKNGQNFNRRFAVTMDRLTRLRELNDICIKMTSRLNEDWPVLKDFPLMEEFFCS